MMEAVREWITSIVMVTMLLSAAQTLVPEGTIRKMFSFGGGLVLMMILLQPILRMDAGDLTFQPESYGERVEVRREELEEQVREEWKTIIEEETAAYISDKADALGLDISAEVLADTGRDGLPVLTAELAGEPSEILAEYLAVELGIPRERQVWRHERKH